MASRSRCRSSSAQSYGWRSTSAERASPMTKLPAASAILMVAVLAAAAPAAQGRRVLVAVERDAHSPAGGVLSGALPNGSRTYLIDVPVGRNPRAFATKVARRPHILADQVDHRLRLRTAQQSPVGCADRPDPAYKAIATATNSELADVGGPTKPIAILDSGIDPSVPELANRV